ncbi:MAG: site-specific integrase [Planctomycetota bacterium]
MYLGRADLPEAKQRYARAVAESGANGGRRSVPQAELTVIELVNAFRRHCEADALDKRDLGHFKSAWTPIVELYGDTPVAAFGPLKLKTVRERLIVAGKRPRCRGYVNRLTKGIRFIFKWGVAEELVPVAVYESLRAVPGLKRGKTDAAESEPVKPVRQEHVDAIRPYLSRQVAALIDLQLLTAARPGELVIMRPIDIDTTGKVWTYAPTTHKTAYRGHGRAIYLGPKAQEVVRPFLAGRGVEAFLFSPAEAVAEQREDRHAARVTPLSCGNVPGSNVKRHPRRTLGERYTPESYRQAVQYACERAGVPRWFPYQLRHSAATNLRKQFGLDVTSTMLGHVRCDVTQIYAERDASKAAAVALKIG